MFKVLIPRTISHTGTDYLKEKGCELILSVPASAFDPVFEQCHAILTGPSKKFRYDKTLLERCKNLKVISSFSAGVDYIDTCYAEKLGIQVTNSGNANSNAVAEHTIFFVLACAKNHEIMSDAVKKSDFSIRKDIFNIELSGLTLGLIGFGNIGRLVAKKAAMGFDMKVIVYDHHLTRANAPFGVIPVSSPEEVYRNADFISLHVPYTEKNRHMVAKEQLDMMKPSSFLINVSRGGLIQEEDLIQAVKDKKIKGAALDVFEKEPLPADSGLLQYDNIIVSPHCAANTRVALDRMELFAAMDIWRVLNGERPEFPVNHPFSP
ncbi:hydroxyacid dehydrogenase [Lacrimispora sp. 38-1]|uniref:hydroxyacid dehydrogenase n=1 Tax=Lacrimispora sp. 38-1 TaxID=3125778 RepID=UPI003CF323BF